MNRPRPEERRLTDDERGASIAVTHVLAIGVTTILVSTLLLGAGGLLSDQRERAAREELRVIGNRIAYQISEASVTAGQNGDPGLTDSRSSLELTLFVDQPGSISGGSYSIDLLDDASQCAPPRQPPDESLDGPGEFDSCLELSVNRPDVTVQVPVDHPNLDRTTSPPELSISKVGGGELEVVVEITY